MFHSHAYTEAEYAHRLNKRMVPIRLQPKYTPDGWLAFMLGNTFFYDLSKPAEYDNSFQKFVKVLNNEGKINPGERKFTLNYLTYSA